MKNRLFIPSLCLLPVFAFAELISVTDGAGNNYGNTEGFAIDFDSTSTGITADWSPDLSAGTLYSVDSVSIFEENNLDTDFFLGVYTGLSGTTPSGFLGVSDNTVNFSDQAGIVTWNFSGITVTPETNPGSGGDVLFFLYQEGTTALGAVPNRGNNTTAYRRIDGENGSFADELSAVIDGGVSTALRINRSPEYQAQVSVAIPEPQTVGLLLLGVAAVGRRFGRKR